MVCLIKRTIKLSFKGPAPVCEGTQYFFFPMSFCLYFAYLTGITTVNVTERLLDTKYWADCFMGIIPHYITSRMHVFSYQTLTLRRENTGAVPQEGSYITRLSVFTEWGRRENAFIRPAEFDKQLLGGHLSLSLVLFSQKAFTLKELAEKKIYIYQLLLQHN